MRAARELAQALRAGQASVPEVLEETLARSGVIDPLLNCTITAADPHALRREARLLQQEIDAGGRRGPLHGVPIGIKDIIQTKGLRTTGGSGALDDWIPDADATVVARLRAAGALIVAKHNTHEFAFGVTTNNARFGPCRNPWDRDRIPGGSSGGSAAAVAAGLCVGAIGTDTGSSIRRPAAFCGTVGLKPAYGRVSRNGVMMVAWSLDHVGPIADSMFDAVALLDAIAGPDREDQSCGIEPWHPMLPTLVTSHGLRRAGVPRRWVESMCEPAVAARFDEACRTAESLGLQLVDVDPPHREALQPALRLISLVEAYVVHEAQFAERGARYSDELAALVRLGRAIPAPDYVKAQQLRARVRAWLNETFQTIDLILSPTMPVVAPPIVASVDPNTPPSVVGDTSGLFCALAPLGGMQSISLPMGLARNLPCGVLLTSPAKHERASMRLAAALEARLPARSMPPL